MKKNEITPNDNVLSYYFYFIQERMNIFWRKQKGETDNLTDDLIFKKYKFTNVYRATDRVSQYLIKDVIYSAMDSCKPEDMILRIIIFKVFNKIETWEFLKDNIEEITIENYDPSYISEVLTRRRATDAIFNNAYMMTGTHHLYNTYKYKHEKWLWMIKKEIVEKNICSRILKTKSLEELYELLHQCSFLGDFLSYQYAIDINYTPYLNFSENSFDCTACPCQWTLCQRLPPCCLTAHCVLQPRNVLDKTYWSLSSLLYLPFCFFPPRFIIKLNHTFIVWFSIKKRESVSAVGYLCLKHLTNL